MKQRGREKAALHQVIRTGNQKQLLVFLIWQDLFPQMQAFEPAAQLCVTRNKMEKQFAHVIKELKYLIFKNRIKSRPFLARLFILFFSNTVICCKEVLQNTVHEFPLIINCFSDRGSTIIQFPNIIIYISGIDDQGVFFCVSV